MRQSSSGCGATETYKVYVVVVRTEDSALAADQLLTGLTEVDEGTFVVDAVTE